MRFIKPNPHTRRSAESWSVFFALLILLGCFSIFTGETQPAKASGRRVVMLGFDGMDYNTISKYLDEGKLPNLARLRDKGVFSPLMSSNPAESPVAWSTLVTGTNPGKTGIFDFLRRDPQTYFPELNMTDVIMEPKFINKTIPVRAAVLRNARHGNSFWGYAAEAGIKATGIMMPMNMPPDTAKGSEILSGLGVPDIRRTMGTYVYYVDDKEVAIKRTGSSGGTEMGGRVIEVVRQDNDIQTFLPGPFDPLKPGTSEELRAPVSITVDPEGGSIDFKITNKTPFMFITFFGGAIAALVISLLLWPVFAIVFKNSLKGFTLVLVLFIVALGIFWFMSKPTIKTEEVKLANGQWSDWIPVKYLVTPWVGVEGFFKVFLIEAGPEFQVYVTPVNVDPRGTRVAISSPTKYASQLLNQYGNFKTYGWDSETWALNENVIDEKTYLDDTFATFDMKENMVFDQMKHGDWTIFASVFQATDHVSHMFWRFMDPTHPMYDPILAEKYGDSVLQVYQHADKLVGRVMDEVLDQDDVLIVMSDHGFNSFRKAVNVNRWLIDHGYLAEKDAPGASSEKSSVYNLFSKNSKFFQWVDWSRSKAYALGLGQIYINLEGREKQGIVTENERSALIDEIIAGLHDLRDPDTGELVLINAYRADKLYQGDNMEYAPDIVLGFAPGYRVSWQTTLGVAADKLVEPNMRKWSGDHCSFDPSHTRGVLFTNMPITVEDPGLLDLTPSILKLVGVDKPVRCDGRVIF
jgi:predicted AlkP superfamily phosphohydrolase/phosphomutase